MARNGITRINCCLECQVTGVRAWLILTLLYDAVCFFHHFKLIRGIIVDRQTPLNWCWYQCHVDGKVDGQYEQHPPPGDAPSLAKWLTLSKSLEHYFLLSGSSTVSGIVPTVLQYFQRAYLPQLYGIFFSYLNCYAVSYKDGNLQILWKKKI